MNPFTFALLCVLWVAVGDARIHRLELDRTPDLDITSPISEPDAAHAIGPGPQKVSYSQRYFGLPQVSQASVLGGASRFESIPGHTGGHRRNVPLSRYLGSQYYAVLAMGTPPVEFKMILDTGSANLWIPATQCAFTSCFLRARYDHNKSSTYIENGTEIVIPYGKGLIEGFVSQDDIILDTLSVEHQEFVEVVVASGGGLGLGSSWTTDGVLGLAFDTLSIDGIVPPFYNMLAQNHLDEPLFAFQLGPSEGQSAAVTFGGIDHSAYSGYLHYHSLRRSGLWEVDLERVTFGDSTLELANMGAAFDTGISSIMVSSRLAYIYNKQIGASKWNEDQYSVDCACVPDLPDLSFTIGGIVYTLTGEEYIRKAGNFCISPFVGMDLPGSVAPLWIIGDVFLKKYYTVFHFGRKAVGLAVARGAKDP